MLHLAKHHSVHKRLSSFGLLFGIPAAIVWIDVLYDFFRDVILIPLYESIPDSGYIFIMLVLPTLSLILSVLGYHKAPREEKHFCFLIVLLSVALVVLMAYAISPLGSSPLL